MKYMDEHHTDIEVCSYSDKYTNIMLDGSILGAGFVTLEIDLPKEQAIEIAREILEYYGEE